MVAQACFVCICEGKAGEFEIQESLGYIGFNLKKKRERERERKERKKKERNASDL